MSSAIVDAYLYSGAYLYCTKYIEPTLQEASIVNYQPSLASQELIQNNPNIVEVAEKALSQTLRKELENRLANSIDLKVGEISWDVNRTVEGQMQSESTSSLQGSDQEEEQQNEFFYYSEEEKAKESDTEYGE